MGYNLGVTNHDAELLARRIHYSMLQAIMNMLEDLITRILLPELEKLFAKYWGAPPAPAAPTTPIATAFEVTHFDAPRRRVNRYAVSYPSPPDVSGAEK
jgi:hypothetical protein